MGRSFFDLLRREDGVVAVIFAVMAIPFIAMAGWAVDYVRLQHVKDFLQAQVDSAALAATFEDTDAGIDFGDIELSAEAQINLQYRGEWARNAKVSVLKTATGRYEAVASADVPLAFIKLLPGIGESQEVSVLAVAESGDLKEIYTAPKFTSLEFEAHDFNRIWLYCFWPERKRTNSGLPWRTQMVPIADNGGSIFTPDPGIPGNEDEPIADAALRDLYNQKTSGDPEKLDRSPDGVWRMTANRRGLDRHYHYVMPQCPAGSHLSVMLENVTSALYDVRHRNRPGWIWDEDKEESNGYKRYKYFSDTEERAGESPDHTSMAGFTLMETILCDTIEECTPGHRNSIIPKRPPKSPPLQASEGCMGNSGKFMYYGFEDRPIERYRDTDEDFNDIRIVMACAETVMAGERNPMLVE